MLSEKEKKVLLRVSKHGLGISKRPFLDIAEKAALTEKEVIGVLLDLQDKGIIKRLRAVIDHRQAGYKENALIAWRVLPEKMDSIKRVFIENDAISHCYERKPQEEFDYNVFTMMHAEDMKIIEDFAGGVAEKFGVDCEVLITEEELKKERLDIEALLCS
ncbi:MAG: Lrp/AsnC family transcriptional regulator [Candidatus Omnitrophica bacterium]|nr:Lrp/AsnC family transcriptional regulator [Candidatus Omnitrophota bacterium]